MSMLESVCGSLCIYFLKSFPFDVLNYILMISFQLNHFFLRI